MAPRLAQAGRRGRVPAVAVAAGAATLLTALVTLPWSATAVHQHKHDFAVDNPSKVSAVRQAGLSSTEAYTAEVVYRNSNLLGAHSVLYEATTDNYTRGTAVYHVGPWHMSSTNAVRSQAEDDVVFDSATALNVTELKG